MSKSNYKPNNVTVSLAKAFPKKIESSRGIKIQVELRKVFKEDYETKVKTDRDETIKMVRDYLLSRKFAGEGSAKQTSRKVGVIIKKYGITTPDLNGLKQLAEGMEKVELENTTRRSYLYAFQVWAEATGKPIDIKKVIKRAPPLKQNQIEAIPPEIIKRIPGACGNYRDLALVMVGLYCGLRGGEAVWLRTEDVDIKQHIIHVRNRGRKTLKNRRERDVPIPDALIPYLNDWVASRDSFLSSRGINLSPPEDYFFITVKCRPLDPISLGEIMRNLKKKLGIPKNKRFTYHMLRHTCNSHALATGATPDQCIENFGWSDAKIMVRYTHASIEKRKEAMKDFSYDLGDDHNV